MDDTATRIASLIRGSVNRQITMSEVLEKVQSRELAERCTQETVDELISLVQFTWGTGGTYRDFLIRVFSVYAESVQNAGKPAEACRLLDAAEMMRKRLAEAAIRSFEQAISANDTPQLAAAAGRLWEVAIPETMETREQAIDTMLLARRVGEELRKREMFLQAVPFHHVLCKASMGIGDDNVDSDVQHYAECLIRVARDPRALSVLSQREELPPAELNENEPLTRSLMDAVGEDRQDLDLLRLAIRAFPGLGIASK